jgi:tetratricopeptide (TPR) repeat protein
MLLLCLNGAVAQQKSNTEWDRNHYLVERLGAEVYKIDKLLEELKQLGEIVKELRDIEVFPAGVTRLDEDKLLGFDKRCEYFEKRHQGLLEQTTALRSPLADALSIVREMVQNEPVAEMFELLERGDMERIGSMRVIRKQIRGLWAEVDGFLADFVTSLDIVKPAAVQHSGLDREFHEIMQANLGMQYQQIFGTMTLIKDTLAGRADAGQAKLMMRYELKGLQPQLRAQGCAPQLLTKLQSLRARYAAKLSVTHIDMLLARTELACGNFEQAIQRASSLPAGAEFDGLKELYTLQGLYRLEHYVELWQRAQKIDFSLLVGHQRNVALWLSIEAGLHAAPGVDFTDFATKVVIDSSYASHVLYAFAKSYVKRDELQSAHTIFKRASEFKPQGSIDLQMQQRARLATAQTEYELGLYEQARKNFFELLQDAGSFEQALSGISWCYIKQGKFDKAEQSLRKLINQSPSSTLAVEAILTLAKYNRHKAGRDWELMQYLHGEQQRLSSFSTRLNQALQQDSSSTGAGQRKKALAQVKGYLDTLRAVASPDYASIRAQYQSASHICDIVQTLYATGSFQEQALSSQRERILYQLDSLLLTLSGPQSATTSSPMHFGGHRQSIASIKQLVARSRTQKVMNELDWYRWHQEHIDWLKRGVTHSLDSIKTVLSAPQDSTALKGLTARRALLNTRLDSLVEAGDMLVSQWSSKLIPACEGVLATLSDTTDEAFIRYQYGELLYTQENLRYAQVYQHYESALLRYESLNQAYQHDTTIEVPLQPMPPELTHDASRAVFSEGLRRFPTHALTGAFHYSLAWCHSDLGLADSALLHMRQLATTFPDHHYTPQAWMYIGEHLFDTGNLEEAVEAYKMVMNYPRSSWFDDALYKFAWTQYRLSNPEKAISSFLALVDLGSSRVDGKAILQKESMDYIAISFSESDMSGEKGLERAKRFVKRFGDEQKGTQILSQLARVYAEQGRYDLSKKSYQTLLDMYPQYGGSWEIESKLIDLTGKEMGQEETNQMRLRYFSTYHKSAAWSQAQTDPSMRAKADSTASTMLYDAALSYHQMALQKSDSQLYSRAADAYEQFISAYTTHPMTNECHYNFAEIKFSQGDYDRAAREYIAVSRRYPDSKYRETAAWNAIVASQTLLKQEQSAK